MTGKIVTDRMKADKCLTASRGRSNKKHRNYSNKYTKKLGQMGYPGINKEGYFTKFYSYGVIGHCCIFVQYWLIMSGLQAFVPKHKGFIENTNKYAAWLKSEPTIKGYGKVDWTWDPKKAKVGAIVFKGKRGRIPFSHTCCFLKYEKGYVYTVDGNITGKYNGKKVNNGLVKKRKFKDFHWGFANMPYPQPVKKTGYNTRDTYVLQHTMNLREDHNSKSKKIGTMKKGTKVKPQAVFKSKGGSYWLKVPYGWVCAKTPKNLYIK